jgi:hypothetical protein
MTENGNDSIVPFLLFSGRYGYSSEPAEPCNPAESTTGCLSGCRPAGDGRSWHTTHQHTSEPQCKCYRFVSFLLSVGDESYTMEGPVIITSYNRIGKVYSLEYTKIPKCHITGNNISGTTKGIKATMVSKVIVCNNGIQGHCCNNVTQGHRLTLEHIFVTVLSLVIVATM